MLCTWKRSFLADTAKAFSVDRAGAMGKDGLFVGTGWIPFVAVEIVHRILEGQFLHYPIPGDLGNN